MSIFNALIKLRNQVSTLLAYSYQKTEWIPAIPKDIQSLREFMGSKYRWKSDPLFGLLDHIQPIKHMNYSLKHKGFIDGDCDDLATYTLWLAWAMGADTAVRINMPNVQHVIGAFLVSDGWCVCSNCDLMGPYLNFAKTQAKIVEVFGGDALKCAVFEHLTEIS